MGEEVGGAGRNRLRREEADTGETPGQSSGFQDAEVAMSAAQARRHLILIAVAAGRQAGRQAGKQAGN